MHESGILWSEAPGSCLKFTYLCHIFAISEQPGVVETRDDTPHLIQHVGEVPLSHDEQRGKLMNMLHILTITKNPVSIRQFVDQGMQVLFMNLGSFIKEEGQIIAQGRREERMFILDTDDLAMFHLHKDKRSSRISTCGTSG